MNRASSRKRSGKVVDLKVLKWNCSCRKDGGHGQSRHWEKSLPRTTDEAIGKMWEITNLRK